jgi:hypothetical protein
MMPIPANSGRDGSACLFAPIKDFPPLIRNALARAAGCDAGGLGELNVQERNLLCRIVRNVNASSPTQSVRIANDTLAIALKVSDRTIRRIKVRLEEKGWLSRSQVQSRRLGMQISDVWLSAQALRTLGLIDTSDRLLGPEELAAPLPAAQYDAAQATFHDELPADLLELRDVAGLSVPGIRLLMGLASQSGTRLGHVFAATRDLVLASRKPFAYLQKLIRSGKDWSQIIVTAQAEEQTTAAEAIQSTEKAQMLEAFKGRLFSHEKRLFVWSEFGGIFHQARIENRTEAGMESWQPILDTAPLREAWKAGKLFEITQETLSEWRSAVLDSHEKAPSTPQDLSLPSIGLTQNTAEKTVPNNHIDTTSCGPDLMTPPQNKQDTLLASNTKNAIDAATHRQPRLEEGADTAKGEAIPETAHAQVFSTVEEMPASWTPMSDAILVIPQSLQRQLVGPSEQPETTPHEKTPTRSQVFSSPSLEGVACSNRSGGSVNPVTKQLEECLISLNVEMHHEKQGGVSQQALGSKKQEPHSSNGRFHVVQQETEHSKNRPSEQTHLSHSNQATLENSCEQNRLNALLTRAMGCRKQSLNMT